MTWTANSDLISPLIEFIVNSNVPVDELNTASDRVAVVEIVPGVFSSIMVICMIGTT